MKQQVEKSHYEFNKYMDKRRWASIWHQLDEVQRLTPKNILEIGLGTGLFKAAASTLNLHVETLDIASDLNPDHIGSADSIPLPAKSFDVVCAFQVLEHMPFETTLNALQEMTRVARKALVISLPDAKTAWPSSIKIPLLKPKKILVNNPFFIKKKHVFDGEHHWEINKKEYPLSRIISSMQDVAPRAPIRTYRVHEHPYHRFFILDFSKCPPPPEAGNGNQ